MTVQLNNSNNLNISIIVAMAKNGAIGKNNQLLWHLPNDLKRFKALTMGKPVVMGRKTFESILNSLGKPLPGRDNLVLTSGVNYHQYFPNIANSLDTSVKVFNNIHKLLDHLAINYHDTEIMIIGGGEIYKQFLAVANKIYLTLVDTNAVLEADVFFPDIDLNIWHEKTDNKVNNYQDDQHKYNYSFIEYQRLF
jgi:dihydrofolate reductase